jgi:putative nucleotidyltransferase with HDIG domain
MSNQSTLVGERAAPADWRKLAAPRAIPSGDQLEEIVEEGLPTLPGYIFELNARLKANLVDLDDIAWLIATDPCLSAQVLRICHAMPFAKPVLHIPKAVAMIGPARLRALVLTSPLLPTPEPMGRRQTQRLGHSFWQHSPWTALLSERLAEWTGYPDPNKAYVAGLLHDIGKVPLVLQGIFTEGKVDESSHHAEIGRLLAEAWNYPSELVEALAFHHCPRQAHVDPALTGIVAAADQYGERCGLGFDLEKPRLSRPETAEVVAIVQECLPRLSRQVVTQVAANLENSFLAMLRALGQRLTQGSSQSPTPHK